LSALERAEADIASGDYGRARRRLESYVMAKGYDPELMTRLGQISYDMHDLFNAGRHWLLSTAQGVDVDRAIRAFLKLAGPHPHQIAMQVLRAARLPTISDYPDIVQMRLTRLKIADAFAVALTNPRKEEYRLGWKGRVLAVVFVIVLLAMCTFMIIGIHSVFH
jgi:hypothetical protein